MDSDDSSSSSSSSAEHSHVPSPASSSTPPAPSPKRKAGRKKFRETRHPIYRGVRRRDGGKWVCEVRQPNGKARLWLGTYPNPEMAARAHDVAAVALRGASAPLNFPDLAAGLPRPKSASHADIRRAAAEAAEMFGPRSRSSSPKPKPEPEPEEAHFVDEEALFNMPGLLREMAEGLMLAPPAMQGGGGGGGFDWDGTECCNDHMNLWSNN